MAGAAQSKARPSASKRLHTSLRFLKSSLVVDSATTPNATIANWLDEERQSASLSIERIPLTDLESWEFTENGCFAHRSKRFFSIQGIEVATDWGPITNWDQPIIDQPEVGFLGIIAREFDGILHFLMQAKVEPGNINAVQISPTLQATKSNYTRAHGGATPQYLEHFMDAKPEEVLLDQLQSEQGARFLAKRNRNIIIEPQRPLSAMRNFRWLTLGQIKRLLRQPNVINMDTRTVISGISYGEFDDRAEYYFDLFATHFSTSNLPAISLLRSFLHAGESLHSLEEILSWVTHLRSRYELRVSRKPLAELRQWQIENDCIRHQANRFFKVIGTRVDIRGREVRAWSQPLIESAQEGLLAFIIKPINGIYHFLVQAKLEPGNFDIIEFAPTVQCLTGNFRDTAPEKRPPYLDYILTAQPQQLLFDTMQSEEGGRFFQEQNRNLLVLADEDFPLETSENYRWMTLNQIKQFIRFNNYLNMQARSLISAISFT
ncbi:NDP-hexose 2,3-dehydratase family protein [Azonexus hydrophilus]|uniref:NDP-hexose 2,3-dehydratase family protein n=3 Tax=Azonexus hydrophilus TaxID=418702 RepID=UPI0003FF78D4|nr:NDP-hexose 2,3-dehydratase family protein [Azonexus hydrophilus]